MYKGRSAGLIGRGFVLLIVAAVLVGAGMANPSTPIGWIGALAALLGAISLGIGVWTLAGNVDYLAQRAAAGYPADRSGPA